MKAKTAKANELMNLFAYEGKRGWGKKLKEGGLQGGQFSNARMIPALGQQELCL